MVAVGICKFAVPYPKDFVDKTLVLSVTFLPSLLASFLSSWQFQFFVQAIQQEIFSFWVHFSERTTFVSSHRSLIEIHTMLYFSVNSLCKSQDPKEPSCYQTVADVKVFSFTLTLNCTPFKAVNCQFIAVKLRTKIIFFLYPKSSVLVLNCRH